MNRSFFDRPDPVLYTASMNFSTKISANPAACGLSPSQADAYAALNALWTAAYEAARDPATRTQSRVAAKNAARKALRKMASDLAWIISGTPAVTDAQKIDLGLSVRRPPSPIPPPADRPGMDLISVTGRTVMLRIHDLASVSRRGKPAGVAAAWVYTFVGENYPADPAHWTFAGATTRAKYRIVFPDDTPNDQQVWIAALWINRKQEAGPMSAPLTTNLPGGGTASGVADIRLAA
jgi:hypothetical protein